MTTAPPPSLKLVTVDGGAACGKGAVATRLAAALSLHYLDSGVYYRALGYLAFIQKTASDDEQALISLTKMLRLNFDGGRVFLKYESAPIDITDPIRTEEASVMSSKVSMWPGVRSALMDAQRAALKSPGLVAEGRDMGTVVFPQASVKFFMLCDLAERAKRRVLQLANQGINATIHEVQQALAERDERDLNRAVAPLKAAPEAVVIDSTAMTLEEVVAKCLLICRERHMGSNLNRFNNSPD